MAKSWPSPFKLREKTVLHLQSGGEEKAQCCLQAQPCSEKKAEKSGIRSGMHSEGSTTVETVKIVLH
jgi:hypothetical protein